eukprot:6209858-Pleurochrysis_carterae.AAC.1
MTAEIEYVCPARNRTHAHDGDFDASEGGRRSLSGCGTFGEECARSRSARPWTSEEVRSDGVLTGRYGNLWLVDFNDGNGGVSLARKAFCF